jgi:hypothetical protein
VVSLPKGIFSPYSGFKTDILLIDKQIAKQNEIVLFVNVRADGFDPGATKRPIKENDLPEALKILDDWKRGVFAPSEIAAVDERKLLLDLAESPIHVQNYFKKDAKFTSIWPSVKLGEAIKMNFGTRITKKNDSGTSYPVFGGGSESFRTDNFNRQDEYVISRFAMSEECVRFVAGRFWMLDSGGTFDIQPAYEGKIIKEYVGKLLLHLQDEIYECSRGGGQRNLDVEQLNEIEIPLPPIDVQREILLQLSNLSAEIEAASQQVLLAEEKSTAFIDELWA